MVRFTKALMSLLGQLWEKFAQCPIQNMIVYIMHIWLHVFTCARGSGHETMLNPKTDPTDQGGPVYMTEHQSLGSQAFPALSSQPVPSAAATNGKNIAMSMSSVYQPTKEDSLA